MNYHWYIPAYLLIYTKKCFFLYGRRFFMNFLRSQVVRDSEKKSGLEAIYARISLTWCITVSRVSVRVSLNHFNPFIPLYVNFAILLRDQSAVEGTGRVPNGIDPRSRTLFRHPVVISRGFKRSRARVWCVKLSFLGRRNFVIKLWVIRIYRIDAVNPNEGANAEYVGDNLIISNFKIPDPDRLIKPI